MNLLGGFVFLLAFLNLIFEWKILNDSGKVNNKFTNQASCKHQKHPSRELDKQAKRSTPIQKAISVGVAQAIHHGKGNPFVVEGIKAKIYPSL